MRVSTHTHKHMYSLITVCFARRMIKLVVVVPREALYLRDNQIFVPCELSFLFRLTYSLAGLVFCCSLTLLWV